MAHTADTHPVTTPGSCKHHDTYVPVSPRETWDDPRGLRVRRCAECDERVHPDECDHDEYDEDAECLRCGLRCRHVGTFSWVSGSVFGATLACDDCGLQAAC